MGYPMTFQRVLGRNRIDDAIGWHAYAGADVDESDHPRLALAYAGWRNASERYNQRVKSLMDDLERLRLDTLDEGAVVQNIAARLGLDPGLVAVVLKEYLSV